MYISGKGKKNEILMIKKKKFDFSTYLKFTLDHEEEDIAYEKERHEELMQKAQEYGLEDAIEGYDDDSIEVIITEFEEEMAREENKDLCSYFNSTRGCK